MLLHNTHITNLLLLYVTNVSWVRLIQTGTGRVHISSFIKRQNITRSHFARLLLKEVPV